MADVFVSYASQDRERVIPLVEALESEGLSIWWDRHIGTGTSFDHEIERELDASTCVVVVWTHASIASDWVRNEATEGHGRGVLMPVQFDDVRVPLAFRRMQTARLVGWPQARDQAELAQLVSGIRAIVGKDVVDSIGDQVQSNRPSIAILPFANLSDDERIGYLADGMTDDVITLLSSDPNFSVAARNSAFSYKGEYRDVRTVAQELGVRYVLEGGARGVGERIRVSVQLIEAESGSHLWAERFDRPIAEIFDVQDEVIDGIVVALGGELYRAEAMRAHRRSSESLDAWGLVARATTDLGKLGTSGFEEIDRLTSKAISLDPELALAYAVRANALGMGVSLGAEHDFAETVAVAEQAMALGPDDPLVLAYSANALVWALQPERALPIAQHAYELAPHIATTYGVLGFAYMALGRSDEAIANIERALAMSPRDISRGRWYSTMAATYFRRQQWNESIDAATKSTERMPDFGVAWLQLSTAQRMNGQIESSVQSARTATERAPGFVGGWKSLADALSSAGDYLAAVDAARVANSLPTLPGFIDHWVTLANCLALTGESKEALEIWEHARSVSPAPLSIEQIETTQPEQPVDGLRALGID